MIPLTLEQVVDGLTDFDIRKNYNMDVKGLYCPDRYVINYNPRLINNVEDFFMTILHELAHHYEEPGLDRNTAEFLAESIAFDTLCDERIVSYLGAYFEYEVKTHWA